MTSVLGDGTTWVWGREMLLVLVKRRDAWPTVVHVLCVLLGHGHILQPRVSDSHCAPLVFQAHSPVVRAPAPSPSAWSPRLHFAHFAVYSLPPASPLGHSACREPPKGVTSLEQLIHLEPGVLQQHGVGWEDLQEAPRSPASESMFSVPPQD